MVKGNVVENIIKKYNITTGMHVYKKTLNNIARNEHMKKDEICCILQINRRKQHLLLSGKRKYTKLKFNEYNRFQDKQLLKKGKINYREFEKTREKMNLTKSTLMRNLGITRYRYNRMKNDENYETAIIDIELKHKADLIAIELKYSKRIKKRYCSKEEIEEICNARKIEIDSFIKYYSKNEKQYKLNKLILMSSKKGLWIGENSKMDEKFFYENKEKIYQRLGKLSNKISKIYRCYSDREDIVQDAIIKIQSECGNLVKKFYFDTNLLFNILMVKAKYVMMNSYRREHKIKTVSYNQWNTDKCKTLQDDSNALFGI